MWNVTLTRRDRSGRTVKTTRRTFDTRSDARTWASKFRGDQRTVAVKVA